MKKLLKFSLFSLFLLLQVRLSAQDILKLRHSCSFDGDQEDSELYVNEASDEATKIVAKIMVLNVLTQNFIVKSGNAKNALASVEGKQRYIIYSTSFLESFKSNENAKWAAYCVMAHEIGHHLNNHDMEEMVSTKRKLMEIQSDKFAGGILFRLGATLTQAQSGILLYTNETNSKTHPPKAARLEAVASGWKQAQEQHRATSDDTQPSVKINPEEPVKPQPNQTKADPSVSLASFESQLVFVKGGTFQMGDNDPTSSEKPVHAVTLSDFKIGKYEVTQKQWRDVMGKNELFPNDCDDCPMTGISWEDIQVFLQSLNQKTSKKYRLPTEAEWEYTARGGNKSKGYKYSGSNKVEDVSWYKANSDSQTQPVGSKLPNELGVYDMSGNVWEVCSDWYGRYFSSAATNPTGSNSGSNRVMRGGGYCDSVENSSVLYRGYTDSKSRSINKGFRLVLAQ